MNKQAFTVEDTLCNAQEVIRFLHAHPDFLMHNEGLLPQLRLPHQAGEAVSQTEQHLRLLREENRQLHRKLTQLIETAKNNENLHQRIRQLILTLLNAAPDARTFFDALYTTLRTNFNVEFVVVRLFSMPASAVEPPPEFVEYDAEVFSLFENVLGASKPTCGRLSEAQAYYLFPGHKIGSAMLIPLAIPEPSGLLALGSSDVARYYTGMATDLMGYLGAILSHFLQAGMIHHH